MTVLLDRKVLTKLGHRQVDEVKMSSATMQSRLVEAVSQQTTKRSRTLRKTKPAREQATSCRIQQPTQYTGMLPPLPSQNEHQHHVHSANKQKCDTPSASECLGRRSDLMKPISEPATESTTTTASTNLKHSRPSIRRENSNSSGVTTRHEELSSSQQIQKRYSPGSQLKPVASRTSAPKKMRRYVSPSRNATPSLPLRNTTPPLQETGEVPASSGRSTSRRRSLLMKTISEPALPSQNPLPSSRGLRRTRSTHCRKFSIETLEHRLEKLEKQISEERFDAEVCALMKDTLQLNNDALTDKVRKRQLRRISCQKRQHTIAELQEQLKVYSSEINIFQKFLDFNNDESDRLTKQILLCRRYLTTKNKETLARATVQVVS